MSAQSKLDVLISLVVNLKSEVEKMQKAHNEKMISLSEFSSITGISQNTALRWCQNGEIEATQYNEGGNWRIPYSAVIGVIQEAADNLKDSVEVDGRRISAVAAKKIIQRQIRERAKV